MKKINVVLYHPEIPANTGNIMRSCVGFNATLHLIKPLGFSLDEKHLKRSCVDYIDYVEYIVYEDYNDFLEKNKDGVFYFLTRYGHKSPIDIDFKKDAGDKNVYLVFGAENEGIAYDILKENIDRCFRIPTTDKVRSLNLSNCAAIMLYLASEALNDKDVVFKDEPESLKGSHFIEDVNLDTLDYKHKEYK